MKRNGLFPSMTMVLLTLTLLLGACGTETAASNTQTTAPKANASTSTSTEETDAAQPTLAPVTIVLTVPGGVQKDDALVKAEWDKHLKEKINTELIIEHLPWDSQRDKLTAMLVANEHIDIAFTASWNGYYSDVAKGAFLELDPLLDEYGQDIKRLINPLYLQGPRIGGKLYMIPTNKEIADARAMWFRSDLLAKHNLTVRQDMTIEDFEPMFAAIKENEPGTWPTEGNIGWYGATREDVEYFEKYDYVPGYDYLYVEHATGNVVSKYDLDWFNKRYDIYRDYFKKGYFNTDIQESKVTADDAMKAGQLFSKTGMVKPGEDVLNQTRYNLIETPVMAAAIKPKINTYSTTGAGAAIVSYSKNPERAMMVMNLLWSDETLINLVQSGIEGQHYIKVADVRFHKSLPESISSPGDTGYDPGFFWQFGNDMLNLIWDTEPADKHELYEAYNESGYRSPLLGFYFNPDNVKTEISAISNVLGTYIGVLENGKVDPETTVKEMKEKLRQSGMEKVIAECKTQYDTWKAGN